MCYIQEISYSDRSYPLPPFGKYRIPPKLREVKNITWMDIIIPHIQSLTPSEEDFLDEFLKAVNKINPSLHKSLTHMMRVGILTWILGWGVYSTARSISKIKDNLHTLQKQNQLQDKQIKCLAKFLNLTMHQVSRHSEMLCEMDTKMFMINKTLQM